MLKNGLDTTKCLYHIRSVCVEVPQLTVVALACPPEGVALHVLVDLELGPGPETLVETEGTAILLEESVDTRQTAVPAVLEVLQSQASVLLLSFLTFLGVLYPDTLRVAELRLPRNDVAEDVGDEGLLVVRHTSAVMCDSGVGLLRPSLVASRDQDVRSGDHTKTTKLLGSVEHSRRETRRHFRVQTNLDTSLDLSLTLDDGVQQANSRDSSLTVVCEECNQGCIPLVGNLCEGGRTGRHQDLANAVVKLRDILLSHLQEGNRCALLGRVVNQRPYTILLGKFAALVADLRQNADLKSVHREEQVGVVATVDAGESVIPFYGSDRTWQTVLQIPEDSATEVDIVTHQPHAGVARPALLVLVANDVLKVGIGLFGQERWMRSRESSAGKRKKIQILSM